MSNTASNLPRCPKCGAPLNEQAVGGLCPRCMMTMNMASQTEVPSEAGPHGTRVLQPAPSPEELAAKFPQLEILELLGRGGMGAVYKARQKELDRTVALKILPPGIGDEPAFAERFAREARALARLNHPNIVTLYEFGRTDGLFFFLMEFVDGVNLRQLLESGRIAPREALAIVPQICDALQFAHDHGIVHRDIKPENILMDRRGRVKVADFGLAKIVQSGGARLWSETQPQHIEKRGRTKKSEAAAAGPEDTVALRELSDAGKIMGTPNYMAPEQFEKPAEVDHRADIYALGVVFYQMLTGELPGKRIEPPSKKVQIDVRLDEIVLRALEKNPEHRYEQASVLKTQVETVAMTPAPDPSETIVRPNEPVTAAHCRRPWSLNLVAALFIVAGCFAAWDIAEDFFRSVYSVNFGVLGIPIGVGLLRCRPWWRWTALGALAATAMMLVFVIMLVFAGNRGAYVKFSGTDLSRPASYWVAGLLLLLMLILLGGLFRVLTRPVFAVLFKRRGFHRAWIEWATLGCALLLAFAAAYTFNRETPSGPTSVNNTTWIDHLRLNQPVAAGRSQGVSRYGDDEFSYETLFDGNACAVTVRYRKERDAEYRVQFEEKAGGRRTFDAGVRSTRKHGRQEIVEEKKMMSRAEFDRIAVFVLQKVGDPPVGRLGFSAVAERTVEMLAVPPHWNWFDLETGQNVWPGQDDFELDEAAYAAQMKNMGADFRVAQQGDLRGLDAGNTGCVLVPAAQSDWDSLRADLLPPASAGISNRDATPLLLSARQLPATFYFKTPEGSQGLLQITHFTEVPLGVKIRYKMAQGS
jgi:serine/threonine protein kinase